MAAPPRCAQKRDRESLRLATYGSQQAILPALGLVIMHVCALADIVTLNRFYFTESRRCRRNFFSFACRFSAEEEEFQNPV
jgi:hypothetical protein